MTTISLNAPNPSRRFFLRAAWILLALALLANVVIGLPLLYRDYALPCVSDEYCPILEGGLKLLHLDWDFYAGYHVAWLAAVYLPFVLLCGILTWRKAEDTKTIFFAMAVLAGITTSITYDFPYLIAEAHPVLEIPVGFLFLFGQIALIAFYAFPDGRFSPRWTRWAAGVYVVLSLLLVFWSSGNPLPEDWVWIESIATFLLWYAFPISCAYALLYRYRRIATPEQRQQIKWVVWSVGVAILYMIFDSLVVAGASWLPESGLAPAAYGVFQALISPTIFYLCVLFIAAGFYIAVFKYRLWDVDFLINRSLAYGALTVLLALVFGAVLFALLQIFEAITRQSQSTASIAISALAVGV